MMTISRPYAITAALTLAALSLASPKAEAQVASSQQSTPQSYQPYSCYCPFPQGYCAFPQGYCPPPNCGSGMMSPQAPSVMPQYSFQGYTYPTYGTPTYYIPKPIGLPPGSVPSSQGMVQPNPQMASTRK